MEREVYVADEFEVDCRTCHGDGRIFRVIQVSREGNSFVPGPDAARRDCPDCDGTGKETVYVEGTTTVTVDPPERDVP